MPRWPFAGTPPNLSKTRDTYEWISTTELQLVLPDCDMDCDQITCENGYSVDQRIAVTAIYRGSAKLNNGVRRASAGRRTAVCDLITCAECPILADVSSSPASFSWPSQPGRLSLLWIGTR